MTRSKARRSCTPAGSVRGSRLSNVYSSRQVIRPMSGEPLNDDGPTPIVLFDLVDYCESDEAANLACCPPKCRPCCPKPCNQQTCCPKPCCRPRRICPKKKCCPRPKKRCCKPSCKPKCCKPKCCKKKKFCPVGCKRRRPGAKQCS